MTGISRFARRALAILQSTACNARASNGVLCQQAPASHEGSPEIPEGSEHSKGSPEIPEGSAHSESRPKDVDLSGLSEPTEHSSEDERLRRSDDQEEEEDEAAEGEEEAEESKGECKAREVSLAQSACKQLHSTEILLLELLRKHVLQGGVILVTGFH